MESKKIYCKGYHKYLGMIRDATLYKKITYLCDKCETKRIASDLDNKTNPLTGPFERLFRGGI